MSTIRISDLERDMAAAELGEHFAHGRLTPEEHAERLEAVWVARTEADLRPIFRDLPGGSYGIRPRSTFSAARSVSATRDAPVERRRRIPLIPILVVLMVLTILTKVPLIVFGLLVFALYKAQPWRPRGSGRC